MYEVEAIKQGWRVVRVGKQGGRHTVAEYWSGSKGAFAARELADLLNFHKSDGSMK